MTMNLVRLFWKKRIFNLFMASIKNGYLRQKQ